MFNNGSSLFTRGPNLHPAHTGYDESVRQCAQDYSAALLAQHVFKSRLEEEDRHIFTYIKPFHASGCKKSLDLKLLPACLESESGPSSNEEMHIEGDSQQYRKSNFLSFDTLVNVARLPQFCLFCLIHFCSLNNCANP